MTRTKRSPQATTLRISAHEDSRRDFYADEMAQAKHVKRVVTTSPGNLLAWPAHLLTRAIVNALRPQRFKPRSAA